MTKRKLQRFAENATLPNVFQPKIIYPPVDHEMKGEWNKKYFPQNHPLVLELGCGRGEYTVHLATMFPEKNYIGIDFKGARLWRGAKTSWENNLKHVAFLRIQIQRIESYFAEGEVDELWLTFPDPQPQQSRERKRLTSPRFLNMYKNILKKNGVIHLKTDDRGLYDYTKEVLEENKWTILDSTHDLYQDHLYNEVLQIKTTYEKISLKQGSQICYLKFTC
jgi:tRNA (guanine-N7-)-methyltransferase